MKATLLRTRLPAADGLAPASLAHHVLDVQERHRDSPADIGHSSSRLVGAQGREHAEPHKRLEGRGAEVALGAPRFLKAHEVVRGQQKRLDLSPLQPPTRCVAAEDAEERRRIPRKHRAQAERVQAIGRRGATARLLGAHRASASPPRRSRRCSRPPSPRSARCVRLTLSDTAWTAHTLHRVVELLTGLEPMSKHIAEGRSKV